MKEFKPCFIIPGSPLKDVRNFSCQYKTIWTNTAILINADRKIIENFLRGWYNMNKPFNQPEVVEKYI